MRSVFSVVVFALSCADDPYAPPAQSESYSNACLDLAACVAGCGHPEHCGSVDALDHGCANACEANVPIEIRTTAYLTALSCDVCPSDDCGARSLECGVLRVNP